MEFFPFDIASGPDFLAFYFLFGVALFMFAGIASEQMGYTADRRAREARDAVPDESPTASDAYRGTKPLAPKRRLALGTVPSFGDSWSVAYLASGLEGVSRALVAAASSSGWLNPDPGTKGVFLFVHPAEPVTTPVLESFYRDLAALGRREIKAEEVRVAADAASSMHEEQFQRELVDAALHRAESVRNRLRRIVVVVSMLVIVVGSLRLLRGLGLGRPVGFLTLMIIGYAVVAWFVAARAGRQASSLRAVYLEWLEDATSSMRAQVHAGHVSQPADVTLAAALGGSTFFAMAMALGAFGAVFPAPVSGGSGDSSSIGSSCSSSSCSSSCGGGGCGGSGCGGGGCGG